MMDCPYKKNPEIYEDYILNKLGPDDKATFEKHLQICDACRNNLATENRLIRGIQAAGREELRLELQKQLAEKAQKQQSTNRTIWYRIAAVLFFLALTPGLVYYFWNIHYPETKKQATEPLQVQTEVLSMKSEPPVKKSKEEQKSGQGAGQKALSAPKRTVTLSEEKSRIITDKSDADEAMVEPEAAPIMVAESDMMMDSVKPNGSPTELRFIGSGAGLKRQARKTIATSGKAGNQDVFRFSDGRRVLILNLKPVQQDSAKNEQALPSQIRFKQSRPNPQTKDMTWYLPGKWKWFDPAKVRVRADKDFNLEIDPDSLHFYKIESPDSTGRIYLKKRQKP